MKGSRKVSATWSTQSSKVGPSEAVIAHLPVARWVLGSNLSLDNNKEYRRRDPFIKQVFPLLEEKSKIYIKPIEETDRMVLIDIYRDYIEEKKVGREHRD
jgi:hypothetical protein